MPKYNHKNLGDALSWVYLPGVVLNVYPESPSVAAVNYDTADVQLANQEIYNNIPIFYHCAKDAVKRANGSLADGARGFVVGDEVVCRCLPVEGKKTNRNFSTVVMIGHTTGAKRCSFRYVLVRVRADDLPPLTASSIKDETHASELCIVWDVVGKQLAKIKDPTTGKDFVFPCPLTSIRSFLALVDLEADQELFLWEKQGIDISGVQFASGAPNFRSDFQGKLLGVNATGEVYNDYLVDNPVQKAFADLRNTLMTSTDGFREGKFSALVSKRTELDKSFRTWADRSPGFVMDYREQPCPGVFVPPEELPSSIQIAVSDLQRQRADLSAKKVQKETLAANEQAEIDLISKAITSAGSSLAVLYDQLSKTTNYDAAQALRARIEEVQKGKEAAEASIIAHRAKMDSYNKEVRDIGADIVLIDARIAELLSFNNGVPTYAISPSGQPLIYTSDHVQAAYGEDEIWTCAKNYWAGVVVSYCDAAWKFMRFISLPPNLPIQCPASSRLLSSIYPIGSSPVGDVASMVAADSTVALGNNTFDFASLKRVNEGCYHRTTVPAVLEPGQAEGIGSYLLTQLPIPSMQGEQCYKSAFNTRLEIIDVWSRYDNWLMTLALSFATATADRTWFFRSIGQQWRLQALFLDTPLGTMMCGAPHLQVALWYMYQLTLMNGVARQDFPAETHVLAQAKHNESVICQIYVVQRQGVSLWNEGRSFFGIPMDDFWMQKESFGPYDSLLLHHGQVARGIGSIGSYDPKAQDDGAWLIDEEELAPKAKTGGVGSCSNLKVSPTDPVRFAGPAGLRDDYYTMAPDEQAALIEDRFYVYSGVDLSARGLYPSSRNEVEILAAVDLYPELKRAQGQMNPAKQVRSAAFEKAVADLIKAHYAAVGVGNKAISRFRIDVKII